VSPRALAPSRGQASPAKRLGAIMSPDTIPAACAAIAIAALLLALAVSAHSN